MPVRDVVRSVVGAICPPTAAERAEAAAAEATGDRHATLLRTWPCLQTIEAGPPAIPLSPPRALVVAAWNIERCKRVEDSADLIRRSGADVILATEMDLGMARSGQRHTTRDLAIELGFAYVFGTEFVELGAGDPYETSRFADVPNAHGLHGNAILSRYPLGDPAIIPLDDTGHWFTGAPKSDGQRRVGGRIAITAEIDTGFGPVVLCAVHYESESDADGRFAQTRTLLTRLSALYPDRPVVLGGDLNTNALRGQTPQTCLTRTDAFEPSFSAFRAAGYDWVSANDGAPTTRAAPGRPVQYPLARLDWLFVRGVSAAGPVTLPAVSATGDYLSDHELITARIAQ